ncbi:MAG: polyphosphate kinase 1 [Acidobacteriota bacterium]
MVADSSKASVPSPEHLELQQSTATPPSHIKLPPSIKLDKPIRLFNREFSWIEFNRRVLCEAEDDSNPLLERLKFLSICASNLDEFLMVRLAGVNDLITVSITERTADGLTPAQELRGIRERVSSQQKDIHRCLEGLLPLLAEKGITIQAFEELSKKEQAILATHFRTNLEPILTPLAVDPGHPFPFLSNLTLNLAVKVEPLKGDAHFVLMKIPPQVPRFIPIPGEPGRYIAVESLIGAHVQNFVGGLKVVNVIPFRAIRNADISIREDEVEDLLKSIETELRRRDRKNIVRLEVAAPGDDSLLSLLTEETGIDSDDVSINAGPLRLRDLMQIYEEIHRPSLKNSPFNPRIPTQMATSDDIFSIISRGEVLLHRPYDSFTAVVEFVQAAAEDPAVVAIKQTLYRVDPRSPILEALSTAAQNGKQVTAVVELQARFDEMQNITWARQLEAAGVQVVYGVVGVKTHCKICLIVRREGDELRRYTHLSTGNYNAVTGRYYTDIDLFTRDEAIGIDAAQMMNLLTGFSTATVQDIFDGTVPPLPWKRLIVAPMDYHRWTLSMIEREKENALAGKPSGMIIKLNSLVDPAAIEALYRASQAGVRIDLIVRGICCLVPGVEGLSENIRVISIVDRFLEHARIFLFRNGGETEVYISSGDWMPRNFVRRFEVTFPLMDKGARERVENEILGTMLKDRVKAWKLNSDGTYKRRTPEPGGIRSQERFIAIARSESVRLAPYEEIIRKPGTARRKARKGKKKEKK